MKVYHILFAISLKLLNMNNINKSFFLTKLTKLDRQSKYPKSVKTFLLFARHTKSNDKTKMEITFFKVDKNILFSLSLFKPPYVLFYFAISVLLWFEFLSCTYLH